MNHTRPRDYGGRENKDVMSTDTHTHSKSL